MKETILRDGEIAILIGDVTVIMNLGTVLMAAAMLLPILDKPEKPKEEPKPQPQAPRQESPVKNIVPAPISTGKASNCPTVFVDNFGNVFATPTEAEIQHNMAHGAGSAMKTGSQVLGYGYPRHHTSGMFRDEPARVERYRPINGITGGNDDYRLIYLVEVPKKFLYNGDPEECNKRYKKSISEAKNAVKESINSGTIRLPAQEFMKAVASSLK